MYFRFDDQSAGRSADRKLMALSALTGHCYLDQSALLSPLQTADSSRVFTLIQYRPDIRYPTVLFVC